MFLFLYPQPQPFGQRGREVGLDDLFLGFFDVVIDPVEFDLFLFAVINGTGCSGISVTRLPYRSGVDQVSDVFFDLDLARVSGDERSFDKMVLFSIKEGKMCVSEKTYLRFEVEESLCRIEFAKDVVILIERGSMTDCDILVDDQGALFETLEVVQVAFLETLLSPVNSRGSNGIERFNVVDLTDSLVVVSPDDGDRLEELEFLYDLVWRGSIADHIAEKQELIDLSPLREF